MRISNNLMALNANRMLGITDVKNKKSVEKLSSGYRINRSADDAAGLAISEKMRRLIRGLNQGTKNAVDGVSWTQIGDGALNEAQDILHRMTELTVKALNETNDAEDRMAMELEFEQLQSELDRIGTTTEFNEIPIFERHEVPYYQCEGAVKWDPQQTHVVTGGDNTLTFKYRETEGSAQESVTVTVPAGEYTTQELVDEIESALAEQNVGKEQLVVEFTPGGICNANLEGGEVLDSISGGLSYLFYDVYRGGSFGALIGTTNFPDETSRLKVVSGQNDAMTFTIEDFSGGSQTKSVTIPEGSYTRSELIDLLNNQLADTTVQATAYGNGIKLSSEEAIVTGFSGNMFKIDGSGTVYNSVFYDNVKYGTVVQKAATFTGGYVLPTDSRDEEHKYYEIDSSNNTLTLQPNGRDSAVSVIIPDGRYTAKQMESQLNTLFQGLGVTAEKISSGGYEGIKITSAIKGPDSRIGIDRNSSAYRTLFVTREYNQYGSKVQPVNETTANREGVFKGSRDLSILSSEPLTMVAGVNDAFKLSLNGTEYTIRMTATTYDSVQDIIDELHEQLNGSSALAGYKDKITVSQSGNKIILTGSEGQNINTIRATAITGNKGFDVIFQGYSTTTTYPSASGKGSVTLNTPFDGNIDASESNMTIKVDGTNYTVSLPIGNVNQADIKNAIETTIPGRTVTTDRIFSTVTANGTSTSRNFSNTAKGTTTVKAWTGSAKGASEEKEGVVGFVKNEPAELTLGVSLKSSMPVTTANNTIALTLNGVTKNLTLDTGTYNQTSLQTELQKKIDAAFGTGMGGAIVSADGNELTLTSRLPGGYDGADTSISCNTNTSSFLKELNTTRTAAVWTSNNTLSSDITIDDTNQTFVFKYTEGTTSKNITLTLEKDSYTQDSFVEQLNKQLAKTGTGISADLSSGKLELTSAAKGSDVSIYYATTSGGNSAEELFGPLNQPGPANIVANLKTQDSIKIEAGISDTFTIKVNGTDKTVILDANTGTDSYTRQEFVDMLNQKLAEANAGVTAYVSGTNLGYKTIATGTSASVSMSYAGGGNSMKAIYGTSTTEYAGIKVSFDANGYMSLGSTNANSTISVASTSGGAFQQPVVTSKPINTSYTDGYHSTKHGYIDGVSLSGDVTVNKWNNELKFSFKDNGTTSTVSFEVPEDTYTYAELQTKLQELVDNEVGSNKITVTVGSSGVRLETVGVGSLNQLTGFSGDFYDKVICSCTERSYEQAVYDKNGTQTVDSAYTVGRKNVKTKEVTIRKGISDELSLNLTYGNNVHKINITLDAGTYRGDSLKAHLQEKINEQLQTLGLPENLIEVGVGGINTGVYGSDDKNALNFSLSKTVQAPSEGQFIIDGVSGNAAFEIFYQTDGKMEPAYIMGSKNVSEGVTIDSAETELAFVVDGVKYAIDIPAGDYSAQELLTNINDAFDGIGAPVVAALDEGKLKVSHRKMGEHMIDEVSGSAKYNIFFSENGENKEADARYVKLSSEDGDNIGLKQHVLSTASLGINSCCISQTKNAEKALGRIKTANEKISTIRSDFGSTQNRLEHAINNNQNKEENLQSAESVIRDTDMATEMVAYSKHNILLQAGQAMLTQANHSADDIIALLG